MNVIEGGKNMDNFSKELLKPCPFCGSNKLKLDKQTRNDRTTYSVRCNKCHARGGTSSCMKLQYNLNRVEENFVMTKAIEHWNQRVGE